MNRPQSWIKSVWESRMKVSHGVMYSCQSIQQTRTFCPQQWHPPPPLPSELGTGLVQWARFVFGLKHVLLQVHMIPEGRNLVITIPGFHFRSKNPNGGTHCRKILICITEGKGMRPAVVSRLKNGAVCSVDRKEDERTYKRKKEWKKKNNTNVNGFLICISKSPLTRIHFYLTVYYHLKCIQKREKKSSLRFYSSLLRYVFIKRQRTRVGRKQA